MKAVLPLLGGAALGLAISGTILAAIIIYGPADILIDLGNPP